MQGLRDELFALRRSFAEVVGGNDDGVVGERSENAVVVQGDDEMALADDGGDVKLLAGDGEDTIPAETPAALLGAINEGAHEIAQGVEVRLAGEIGAREDGALNKGRSGKDARLAGEEIGSALRFRGGRRRCDVGGGGSAEVGRAAVRRGALDEGGAGSVEGGANSADGDGVSTAGGVGSDLVS